VPESVAAASAESPESVSFQTEDDPEPQSEPDPEPEPEPKGRSRWQETQAGSLARSERSAGAWKWLLLILVFLAPLGVVGVLVALPYFQSKDPRDIVARQYLDALCRGDLAEANKLSVIVNEHPRNLTRVEKIAPHPSKAEPVTGVFTGLHQFHAEIAAKYAYNEGRGRFEPKDPLGLSLEVLHNAEQITQKAQEQATGGGNAPAKRYSNPEEKVLDDVIARFGAMSELAKNAAGALSSGTLGPTYEDLLERTNIPLSDAERKLALHYLRDPAKWKRLLGDRLFLDLPDLGNFELYDVELVATIRTEGQSLGEPGRPIKLRLVRFVMGSIDTGWRVWHAE
jgi:hypothetical protein